MTWVVKYKREGWKGPARFKFPTPEEADAYAATLRSGRSEKWAHLAPLEFVRVYELGEKHSQSAAVLDDVEAER